LPDIGKESTPGHLSGGRFFLKKCFDIKNLYIERGNLIMSWNIDNAHSQVMFTVRHMMISKVRGSFDKLGGTVNLDPQNPANTTVDIQIETASVNTRDPQRDGHLRSADFFNTETYPMMTFKSKRVEVKGDSIASLVGDLTIRGITKEVALDVEYTGSAKSPWGTTSVGFTAATRINRKDWELTWNKTLETGGMLVGEDIEISIELELVEVPQPEQTVQA
jgi:polyisoprenoid-binding protein YceI